MKNLIPQNELAKIKRPIMIAEEGQANQGDINLAIEMCALAKTAGADGIEFQLFLAEDMYLNTHPGYSLYKSRELDFSEIRDLIEFAHEQGLVFQATGLSPQIIDFCGKSDADVFCINAVDVNNPQIIDSVISTKKPFWVATLMATIEEIDWAVEYILKKGGGNFGLLHGQHVMTLSDGGVPANLLQLDCIPMIKKRYSLPVGFVDHTATKLVPALAAIKGADIITKHLSPYDGWEGPDYKIALTPNEWGECKKMLDYAWDAQGSSKEISAQEMADREVHLRSLYAKSSMPKGHIICPDDLTALRPGAGGINPININKLIGAKLKNEISKNSQIEIKDLIFKESLL